jgi:RNA polymerase sigma-70 factor, ECF subfamily
MHIKCVRAELILRQIGMQTLGRFENQILRQVPSRSFTYRVRRFAECRVSMSSGKYGNEGSTVPETLKDKNANEDGEVQVHDSKLISDGLQGDKDAFEILFSRYRPILYRLAQRILRNHEESEDAVQNCSLAAFRRMSSFKYEGAFRSWLARILFNEAITILRKRKRTYSSECLSPQERVDVEDSLPHPGPNPEQILSQKQSDRALMRKLLQLSAEQRAALLLCEIYEYTTEEAGAMLQVPPGAIRSRLFRARKQLASTLSSPSDSRPAVQKPPARESGVWRNVFSAVRTAWPATRPPHSFLEFRAYPLNVLPSRFRFLDSDNPADPFVARERRNILPFCSRNRIGNESLS